MHGARRAFEITGAPRPLPRHDQLCDQLVALEHGLEIAREQCFDRDRALARRPGDGHARAERDEHRREVHVRIGVRQIPADGRDVAHAHVRACAPCA
jgi:hypothetical protein